LTLGHIRRIKDKLITSAAGRSTAASTIHRRKPKVDGAKKKLDLFLDVAVLDVNSLAAALFAGPAFDPHPPPEPPLPSDAAPPPPPRSQASAHLRLLAQTVSFAGNLLDARFHKLPGFQSQVKVSFSQ
jgi:hypothetical protein